MLKAVFPWPAVDITNIVIPLDRCLTVSEGILEADLVEDAKQHRFDYVLLNSGVSNSPAYRLIPVTRLEELLHSGTPLALSDPTAVEAELRPWASSDWHEVLTYGYGEADHAIPNYTYLHSMKPRLPLGDLLDAFHDQAVVLVRPRYEVYIEDACTKQDVLEEQDLWSSRAAHAVRS